MQCRNCSGNEFRKTESGNYKCAYCGTLYHEEKTGGSKGPGARKSLLIAASAAAILFTGGIIMSLFIFKGGSSPEGTGNKTGVENGVTFTAGNFPEPEGKVLSVDVIPDSIGNHYFLAMCQNTGKVAINAPHVTVRLYSGERKVGSGSGYSFMSDLNPGEITPVLILIQKPPAYTRFETEYNADKPFIIPGNGVFEKRFTGEFSDVQMKQDYGNFYRLKGRIKNTGALGAKFVQVAAVLFDQGGKVIGYDSAYISEKVLKPGYDDLFDMQIVRISGKPDHYKLYYYGTVE